MRNIICILVMALVFAVSCINDAEAAGRNNRHTCICTQPAGTLYQGCPVHRNCIGLGQHAHENMRGRPTSLPIFCNVHGNPGLYYAASCSQVRRAVNEERREARAEAQAERRRQRQINQAIRNNPFSMEMRRGANNALQRAGRNMARDIWGH